MISNEGVLLAGVSNEEQVNNKMTVDCREREPNTHTRRRQCVADEWLHYVIPFFSSEHGRRSEGWRRWRRLAKHTNTS